MTLLEQIDPSDSLFRTSTSTFRESDTWVASWWSSGAERDTAPGFDPDPERRSRRLARGSRR